MKHLTLHRIASLFYCFIATCAQLWTIAAWFWGDTKNEWMNEVYHRENKTSALYVFASDNKDKPLLPDHLENLLIWVDSIKVIPLGLCSMSLECPWGLPNYSRYFPLIKATFQPNICGHFYAYIVYRFAWYSFCFAFESSILLSAVKWSVMSDYYHDLVSQ